jgi:HD-like signal output (HDOD) protein
LDTIRDLVLNRELRRAFKGAVAGGVSLDAAQQHGLLCSAIAPRLLRDNNARKIARCAALIHDVGQGLLACRMPTEYATLLRESQQEGTYIHDKEQETLNITHAEIGAYLLRLWGLPLPVVEAVMLHHAPGRRGITSFDAVGAVHVANALAHDDDGLLDMQFLADVSVIEHLDEWRTLAVEERETAEQKEAA